MHAEPRTRERGKHFELVSANAELAGSTRAPAPCRGVIAGSSPRTRGAPGSTMATHSGPRDHPRVRGEHLRGEVDQVVYLGIIPAYAGSKPSSSNSVHS